MNIKQQLEQVIAEMQNPARVFLGEPANEVVSEWASRLSAIVEQVPDGMVLVPEVLLRQISKWLAESADPYYKAAYAINGLIAAAKEEG